MNKKVLNLASELASLSSEMSNTESTALDQLSAREFAELMNQQDQRVIQAIAEQTLNIAAVIEQAADALRVGGRIIYVGAGTSGRLGVLDASEIPPTFSMSSDKVIAIIAGGERAMFEAQEGVEDNVALGAQTMIENNINSQDIVIGLAASGRTPFVLGALDKAKQLGATTVGIVCNPNSAIERLADTCVCLEVGPEVLSGSTRLKSGSAQKMVLNMISTGAMVKIGKCFGNRMVDLTASNDKLKARSLNLVKEITGAEANEALGALEHSEWKVKTAVLMLSAACSAAEATERLSKNQGQLRLALENK